MSSEKTAASDQAPSTNKKQVQTQQDDHIRVPYSTKALRRTLYPFSKQQYSYHERSHSRTTSKIEEDLD